MSRLIDIYADKDHPWCKFAGTELLDRQGYYAPLAHILADKLNDDQVPYRKEFEFTEYHEIVQRLHGHLMKFERNVKRDDAQ